MQTSRETKSTKSIYLLMNTSVGFTFDLKCKRQRMMVFISIKMFINDFLISMQIFRRMSFANCLFIDTNKNHLNLLYFLWKKNNSSDIRNLWLVLLMHSKRRRRRKKFNGTIVDQARDWNTMNVVVSSSTLFTYILDSSIKTLLSNSSFRQTLFRLEY